MKILYSGIQNIVKVGILFAMFFCYLVPANADLFITSRYENYTLEEGLTWFDYNWVDIVWDDATDAAYVWDDSTQSYIKWFTYTGYLLSTDTSTGTTDTFSGSFSISDGSSLVSSTSNWVNYLALEENNSSEMCSSNIISGENLKEKSITTLLAEIKENTPNELISTDTQTGDPVNLNTGEFIYDNTLMQFAGEGMSFEFNIKYENQAYYNGPIGNNFDYNYNQFLVEGEDETINYHNGKLGVFEFEKISSGYALNDTLNAELNESGSGFILEINNLKTYSFNENKRLTSIEDNFGNILVFDYNDDNQLTKVTDTLDREIIFNYYSHSRIQDITDFNGNQVEFVYFGSGETEGSEYDLKTIKNINGDSEKEISFTYTIGDTFEDSHNVVQLIDSENNIYVENAYDENDRVLSQTYGEGTIYYSYTLSDDDTSILENEVTDRLGNITNYKYDDNGNTIEKTVGTKVYTYEYNADDYISKEIFPLGNGYTYEYDDNNNLIERRFKQDLEENDNDDEDLVTSFEYDLSFNKITEVIEPNGKETNLTLDDDGNVVKKTTIASDIELEEIFEYNSKGQLDKQIDAEQNETEYEYDSGNLTKVTKIGEYEDIEINFEYDDFGNITEITDGEGNITNLSYNDFNLLVLQISPENISSTSQYNLLNKKTKESIILNDGTEVSKTYDYDILDNPTEIEADINDDEIITFVTEYNANSRITETRVGNNATNKFYYDEKGLIIEKETVLNDNSSFSVYYDYDDNDRLVKTTDANGNELYFEYDLFDRVEKQISSEGTYSLLYYDKAGNVIESEVYSESDELLSKSSVDYDLLSRVTKKINYNLEDDEEIETTYTYDNVGNVLTTKNALDQTTTYEYDSFNRAIKTTDNLGNTLEYTYNKNDKVIESTITDTDGKEITTNYSYDDDNRLIETEDVLGNIVSYEYNNLSQIISKTDANGIETSYTYDYTGNLLTETTEDKTITYEYDIYGNMIKLIDSNGNETIYEFDDLNRLTTQTYADQNSVIYTYDDNSNVSSKTDANGTVVNYSYDSLNRLTGKDITLGESVEGVTEETFKYDSLGRLTKASDDLGVEILFTYDSLNRLSSETNNGKTIDYTYDILGNRTSIEIDGKTTEYSYDSNSRLESIQRENEELVKYNYNSLNLLEKKYSNGLSTSYSYDSLNRLESLNNSINSYEYSFDNNSNILSNGIDNYIYDNLNHVEEVTYSTNNKNKNLIETFNYDSMGNRTVTTEKTENTVSEEKNNKAKNIKEKITKEYSTNYTINELNQYTEIEADRQTQIIEYDNAGNITRIDDRIYTYDYKNRLVKVEQEIEILVKSYNQNKGKNTKQEEPETEIILEPIVSYNYDALGRRIEKTNPTETITYYYSGNNVILEEKTNKKKQTRKNKQEKINKKKYYTYSNSLDDVLTMEIVEEKEVVIQNQDNKSKGKNSKPETEIITISNTYFFHKDHLGSTVAITDKNTKIITTYDYDAFGNVYNKLNPNGKELLNHKLDLDFNNILYTGREYDQEIGLYYNRARYYNPETGRFISRDPIDISDDVNLYSYVGNNGVMFVDLYGKQKQLLEDIENGNSFTVQIIARGLQATNMGVHTFIQINSIDTNFNIKSYSIGGHYDELTGNLDGRFNKPSDILWEGDFKDYLTISTPEGMTSGEFVENIYEEYLDYNNNQKDYRLNGSAVINDTAGNCHNFSTSIIYKASGGDQNILKSISDFNPSGVNPGIGDYFNY